MIMAWKIFDSKVVDGIPMPHTLFCGLKGSRALPLNEWLEAEAKDGKNGSGQTTYTTGFHSYSQLKDVRQWFKTARAEGRVVCRVMITEYRQKPRAVRPTYLSKFMYIYAKDWYARINAEEL